MDTGASLMATPPDIYSQFMDKISQFSDCDDINKFPIITFIIDDSKYTLEPHEYILGDQNTINYDKN